MVSFSSTFSNTFKNSSESNIKKNQYVYKYVKQYNSNKDPTYIVSSTLFRNIDIKMYNTVKSS